VDCGVVHPATGPAALRDARPVSSRLFLSVLNVKLKSACNAD